ncbi:MAG: F0F1 ATP synthase subunit epsilon [Proteobacteria bacterium]|nr:F0F1 ATP synthase subunit epsilon [Pseudomonadota bacterium]
MSNLKLEIISPEGVIFNGHCHMAVVPSVLGDIGFMEGHEAVVALIREGQITIFDDKQNALKQIPVAGGYAEINESGKLLVLIESSSVQS